MKTESIEEIANEYLMDGVKIRARDIEKARGDVAISFGFNRYLERVEFMTLCTRLMKQMKLEGDELREYQNFGYDVALFGVNLVEAVERELSDRKE